MSKSKLYIAILFTVSSSYLYSQNWLDDKVIKKFTNDSISISQFSELVKLKCEDKSADTTKCEDYYYKIFNGLNPFPRIFLMEKLESNIDLFWNSMKEESCNYKFDKLQYLKFINDKDNLINESFGYTNEEIAKIKNDFLENYYIKIESE